MGVFTFVCRNSGDEWSAKQLSGDLEVSASSTYELQRRLVQAAVCADPSGGVQSSFSLVTPSSAVFQTLLPSPPISLRSCAVRRRTSTRERGRRRRTRGSSPTSKPTARGVGDLSPKLQII